MSAYPNFGKGKSSTQIICLFVGIWNSCQEGNPFLRGIKLDAEMDGND